MFHVERKRVKTNKLNKNGGQRNLNTKDMTNEEIKKMREEESRNAWHDLGDAYLEVMEELGYELEDVAEGHPY